MPVLSPAIRFVLLELLKGAEGSHYQSSNDIRDMKGNLAHYDRMSKTNPDVWGSDAKRYRRELAASVRERKLWLKAKAELSAADKPATKPKRRAR